MVLKIIINIYLMQTAYSPQQSSQYNAQPQKNEEPSGNNVCLK